jgi:hypothetical protein
MIIKPPDFHHEYLQFLTRQRAAPIADSVGFNSSYPSSSSSSSPSVSTSERFASSLPILVLVGPGIDALCTAQLFISLFRSDEIPFELRPVRCKRDISNLLLEAKSRNSMVSINCSYNGLIYILIIAILYPPFILHLCIFL